MKFRSIYFMLVVLAISPELSAQKAGTKTQVPAAATVNYDQYFKPVKWRNVGPSRGGRSVTSTGVVGNPLVYYMGTTGGGLWKTEDAGTSWHNISDGYFKTGTVGAVAVAESDPNVVYVGMGEHAPRGVTTSYGDGVYKSTDAGKTWKKLGLDLTRQIANIRIHPQNPDVVYVAAQGAIHGATPDRGVYKSVDGGATWKKVLFVDDNTGCADLSMDMTNPRILYAAMWDYRRLPWQVRSGGPGSGLYKSTDGGETWDKIHNGLPKELGKMSVSVCRSNPDKVYALVESDTQKEQGGLFVSNDAGKNWTRISKDHRLVQRAWYYIEVFADPINENIVYVLNSPGLKSMDGGKSWSQLSGTHGDYHFLWINPHNNKNLVISNDGGASVSFNQGATWSTQGNQPTAQFYRINADNLFPYHLYAGQQDNTSVKIESRNPTGWSINEHNWWYSAGGESAFIAFNPDDPKYVLGGSYQGTINAVELGSNEGRNMMIAPIQYQALQPKDMKYRFNWNAPIIWSKHEPDAFYHAANKLFKTTNLGKSWEVVSPDLTRNDITKLGMSGVPYTNEGAGGENYGTIAYVLEAPNEAGVIWTGSDDGYVQLTRDGGKSWKNVTPKGLEECLINSIEVSPHDKATAYIATTRYKFNDFSPAIYKTTDYGTTWTKIVNGIPYGAFTRVVREDDVRKDLLYAGTETGFYISFDGGQQWHNAQLNLPIVPITDLKVHRGDLLASTQGRAFWILDDLAPFRQYAQASATGFSVVTPEDTYRVMARSPLDNVATDDDDDDRPRSMTGINPASGVVIYYSLPAKPDSASVVTIQILNSKGELVRSYSSEKDKKFVAYPGGPSESPVVPKKGGLNRFVWDMRYPSMVGAPNIFIEGSYQGHKASPGTYTVKVKYGTEEKTATFKVLAHPGIQATDAAYEEQHKIMSQIEADVNEIHTAVNTMKSARKQLEALQDLLSGKDEYKPIIESAKAIVKKLNAWEEKVVQPKAQSNDDIINFVNKLSADYIFLEGELDTNIPQVSAGAVEQLAALQATWKGLKAERDALVSKDIADFNNQCKAANLEKITLVK
ncbi:MAG: glycosyl hydrolase [Cyclobacteriaceae bacterium]|nr:glycosyl hydrolase [Cyclobacteriaceae bacterium]